MFVGTVENKLDRKGRVSVPAAYRAHLVNEGMPGFYTYPAPHLETGALEACGMKFMQELNERFARIDLYSEELEELSTLVFASAHQLNWDGEGRVVMPESLIAAAGLTDRVAFVGRGKTFQIWEPDTFEAYRAALQERVRKQPRTVRMMPAGEPGPR